MARKPIQWQSCVNKSTCKPVYGKKKKIKMLLAGLGSVRIGKNCDRDLENAARGLRPRAAFSRSRSQFFPKRTSQPANNIYLLHGAVICVSPEASRYLGYLQKNKRPLF